MARPFRVAVMGGTFDRFHAGHRRLLDAAFRSARQVGIGVTTDAYLSTHPKPQGARIGSFRSRRRALERFLADHYPKSRWWVAPLNDGWGRSVDPGVDLLVISADTVAGGKSVNRERRRRGLPPLPVRVVPLALAEDGMPIASRRIRAGAIDREGRRRRRLSVEIRAPTAVESSLLTSEVRRLVPRARVRVLSAAPPGVRQSADLTLAIRTTDRQTTAEATDSLGRRALRTSRRGGGLDAARSALRALLGSGRAAPPARTLKARRNR